MVQFIVQRDHSNAAEARWSYLEAGVAAEVQQRLHHLQVALVDGDVQRGLPPLVSGVEVGPAALEHLDDRALIPKRSVVHRPVPVLVLRGAPDKPLNSSSPPN